MMWRNKGEKADEEFSRGLDKGRNCRRFVDDRLEGMVERVRIGS